MTLLPPAVFSSVHPSRLLRGVGAGFERGCSLVLRTGLPGEEDRCRECVVLALPLAESQSSSGWMCRALLDIDDFQECSDDCDCE
jgi:hypothetical protein